MSHHRGLPTILAILMALYLAVLAAPAARGENLGPGGGTRVVVGDQVVGPYRLWVTTSPEPAQVGTLTVDVRVSDPASGKKVTDATIDIEMVDPETGDHVSAQATHHDSGNPIDFAAHIPMPKAASYNVTMDIKGPAGAAQVTFTQRVISPRSTSTLVIIGIPFLLVIGGLGAFWLFRPGNRQTQAA